VHQVALAQAALDIVVARAAELGVTRVATVHLLLGEDDEHTERRSVCLGRVSAGTCAQDARLVFETVPGDGVRLAAMDVERDPTDSDKRPHRRGGAIG